MGCQGEEFTAGLLHDFGRMLLAVCFPREFPQLDDMTFEEDGLRVIEHERAIIGIDHCELGAWYAEENRLPQVLVDAIRFHHSPQTATAGRLTALTAVSDHMANHLQRHGVAYDYDIASNTAIAVLQDSGVNALESRIRDIAGHLMEDVVTEVEELVGF